jgi:hypothetical protein
LPATQKVVFLSKQKKEAAFVQQTNISAFRQESVSKFAQGKAANR